MSLGSLQLNYSDDVSDFMRICAERVFALGNVEPSLSYATRQGAVNVHVCSDSKHLAAFFRTILKRDPKRFYRLSRAFDRAHPGSASSAPGWTLTRFSGHVYFSLRLASEIYVYKVPAHLRTKLIDMAFAYDCYLDCSVVAENANTEQHKMPLQLAVELMS